MILVVICDQISQMATIDFGRHFLKCIYIISEKIDTKTLKKVFEVGNYAASWFPILLQYANKTERETYTNTKNTNTNTNTDTNTKNSLNNSGSNETLQNALVWTS